MAAYLLFVMETLVFRVVYLVFLPDCFYTSLFSMVCLIFWIFIVYSFFLAVYLVFVMAKLVFRVFCVFGISTLSRDLQLPSLVVGLASKVLLRVLLQVLRHKLLPQNVQTVTSRNENDQFILTKHGHMDSVLKNAFEMHLEDGFSQRWMGDELLTQEYTFSNLWFENQRSQPFEACFLSPTKAKDALMPVSTENLQMFSEKKFSWFFISPLPLPPPPYEQDHDAADETTKEENHPHSNQKDLIKEDNVNFASSQNAGNTEGECKPRTAIGKRKYRRLMRLSPELWEIPAPDPSSFLPPLTNHFVWKMHQNPLTNHFVWN